LQVPRWRAHELQDAMTRAVYVRRVAPMLSSRHAHLFRLLLTLDRLLLTLDRLLLTLDRLRADRRLTSAELGVFVNGVDTSQIEDTMVFHDKPHWLTNKVRGGGCFENCSA
jgi:predicted amidohydrolase YtcJ